MKTDTRAKLIERVNSLQGLTDDERADLLELLRTQKTYGLVWEDKKEDVEERLRDELPVLIEDETKRLTDGGDEAPNHILIEGDNLEALTTLAYTHAGKIDVIYIDPPYNTGNKDFIYNDSYVDSEDTYRHSKWLSFMAKRLRIAKKLLNENGFICISIDDNEYPNLKSLCDEIFLERNYLTTFHVQVRYAEKSINEEKPFKPLMEYVLIYAKNASIFNPKREAIDYGLEKFCFRIKETSEGEHFFVGQQEVVVFKQGEWEIEKIENGAIDGLKETWITGSIYTTMSYGKVFQTVVEPRVSIDGIGCLYKVIGRGDDGLGYRYYTGPAKKNATKGKMFSGMPLDKVELFNKGEIPKRLLPILTMYDYAPDFGNIRSEGGVPFGSGKKPIKMLKQLIDLHNNANSIVLDFFAGSGSTGHAVMQLNQEDKGHRTFILVTNNENKICEEKTYVRCRNVIDGYNNHEGLHGNNLRYYRTDFVGRSRSPQNLRKLVRLATDMLCIKEDLYAEQPAFAGQEVVKQAFRYFEKGDKRMLVIYREEAVPLLVPLIEQFELPQGERFKVYVFSPSEDPWAGDFEDVQDKVELCALPMAILNAYKRVLPKRKDRNIFVDENASEKHETPQNDSLFPEMEGGER